MAYLSLNQTAWSPGGYPADADVTVRISGTHAVVYPVYPCDWSQSIPERRHATVLSSTT